MKERKGPFGLMVGGIVDSVVQTARRRAQDREPRAVVYNAAGHARLLNAGEPGRDELIEAAGALIDLAVPSAAGAEPGESTAESGDEDAPPA